MWLFLLLLPPGALAQQPGGAIAGVVRDATGAVVRGAQLEVISRATRQVRRTASGEQGEYSFSALLPGEYDLSVDAAGFQRSVRTSVVEAGATMRADFVLRLQNVRNAVTVEAASLQIHYDSPAVSGLITRDQLRGSPLNGRSFLELAKLEPGVQPPAAANRNRTTVAVLGTPALNVGGPRFTIDGGSITSVGLGGAQMGLSQEAVREFQVATVNFDLSAGMTDAGSINVVTRGGGNEHRATAFYFFRDHHLAAYPALTRDDRNPDPFFQRQQFGFAAGGPVRRNRMFYFANWERNDQRAVSSTTLLVPEFAHLSRVTSSPLRGDLLSVRIDGKINDAHSAFLRFSRDTSRAFGPAAAIAGGSPNAYPSNWNRVTTAADQALVAVTSVLRPTLVNDAHLSSFVLSTAGRGPEEQDCAGCLGLNFPSITIAQAGLVIGHSTVTGNLERRLHLTESLTWQAASHRLRFGVDWEHNRDRNLVWSNEPVTMTLYSPARVRAYNAQQGSGQRIPLPASFTTIGDLLQLPLQTVTIGIGDPGVPQERGGISRRWNTVWVYADDVWRAGDRLSLTYGAGWGYDGILNHDLRKPPLLVPLLGDGGLGATRRRWTNVAPAAGGVWTLSSDRKTVVRAAAGRFFRTHGLTSQMDAERVALGPPGLGRQSIPGSAIPNLSSNIPGVPAGTPLDFRVTPTQLTGADLIAMLPALVAAQAKAIAAADRGVQQMQITKQQGAANTAIFPADVRNPSAIHLNVGLQRALVGGIVVSGDFVYRHFTDVPQNGGALDVNRFNSSRGPVIRACAPEEVADPLAICSRGAINVYVAPYWNTYKGLLLRVEKRLSHRWQLLGSYAYSRNSGLNAGTGFNLDDWHQNTGPAPNDLTHILNVSGAVQLPWKIELGGNFAYSSVPPFSAFLGGVDLNGDGVTGDLLPGTSVNAFNRGMGGADLDRLVADFNGSHSGNTAQLKLPGQYAFGDDFHSLDLRISRSFTMRRGLRVSLIGEAFNAYNASNLTEYSGDLTTASFGQPGSRVRQVFGSGGPRSFQVAARVGF